MNTQSDTPAPQWQPITPENQPVFPCWLWSEVQQKSIYFMKPPYGAFDSFPWWNPYSTAACLPQHTAPTAQPELRPIGSLNPAEAEVMVDKFYRGEQPHDEAHAILGSADPRFTEQPAATGTPDAGATPRTMWVEHIEDGTFAGGSEDAYHFDAREKGTEFLVIRKADYDRLLAQLATSRPTAEMVEACAQEICDIDMICIGGDYSDPTAKAVQPSTVSAILAKHFNPEKKP